MWGEESTSVLRKRTEEEGVGALRLGKKNAANPGGHLIYHLMGSQKGNKEHVRGIAA